MDRIAEIQAFVAVADLRSFTRGARRIGVSSAQASKLVARLEDRLGARLLHRTTRDVSLTDTGRAYLDRARELLDSFEALEGSVRDTEEPRGLLKISAPVSFGTVQLAPALMDFAAAWPDVGLEVSFTDRIVNLVDEGFDAAVRITELSDSSLIARRVAETRIVACASPDYLARRGAPASPADLTQHAAILDLNLKDPSIWDFGRGAERVEVRVNGRLRFSDPAACLAAARAGFGIARSPAFVAAPDLRNGRLRTVLQPFERDPLGIYVLYPHPRGLAAKVRAFVDFLAARFAGEPEWSQGWR